MNLEFGHGKFGFTLDMTQLGERGLAVIFSGL